MLARTVRVKWEGTCLSRLYSPASFGLAIIAPSRGVEGPVPTGVHPSRGLRLDDCCENPPKKKWWRLVRANPNPVNLLKD